MHESVLLKESLEFLNLRDDSIIVDCTLGYGGHSSNILKRIPNGHLYSFDQDIDAINYSSERLSKINSNFTIIKSNFKNITAKLNELNVTKVNGILYDLGVSSPQLDVSERGFSYHLDSRLDMRMDKDNKLSAYEVVNNYPYEKLVKIFREYGEEKYSTSIARGIINNRPIETTLELAEIIKENVPFSYRKDKHPARKVFQAIRIEVNDEMNVLNDSLRQALELLTLNSRLCVITFHSLEDKLVKKMFREVSSIPNELSKLPIIPEEYLPKYKEIKTLTPDLKEISSNNRSRSATLRVIERIR
ncbi:MAG: 16S rRNA (cytosine(1402)-N(4))-methyltransferase RsmH [Candidatus Faecisoma sp.]|nr:16S rRNA (cytosine(1402)-N(4))-methyltransferase RsmH [Acholeplasma sp.]MDY2892461.1 16S rRNA (cytosine(1402)-N(4))-methyltransferase RsmH [Candidatus Faecisoma sp.]